MKKQWLQKSKAEESVQGPALQFLRKYPVWGFLTRIVPMKASSNEVVYDMKIGPRAMKVSW
jgi:hypothetical protein